MTIVSRPAPYASADRISACANVTFGTIATSPAPAPISGAISSPTATGIAHQPSAQARTPRVAH